MKNFPRFLYVKAQNKRGFDSYLAMSEEHREQLEEKYGDLFESPADFGVETHPNPLEVRKPAKKDAKPTPSHASRQAAKGKEDRE